MRAAGLPGDGDQLAFLRQLQRLFNEGEFTATYKFALLHAIADLCVERRDAPDGTLHLPLRDLGEKFLELYWNHAAPYQGDMIRQNTKGQAEIIRRLEIARLDFRTLPAYRASAKWAGGVRSAAALIQKMPLWRLQTLGGEPQAFLYGNALVADGIVLNPGVAGCFRLFYPLVLNLVRGHWVSHIRRINTNHAFLRQDGDLEAFLFDSQRRNLQVAEPVLREIQSDHCFYCGGRMDGDFHVDHFIPWARYPRDLGHNFVLAHARCNLSKHDTLAARIHVEHWRERNAAHGGTLAGELASTFTCDVQASNRIARWSYDLDAQAGARLWLRGREYVPFDPEIPLLLPA